MVVNRKVTGRASSVPAGLATGTMTGFLIALLLSALAAYLVSCEMLSMNKIGYSAMIVLILSSCIGAWIAGKRIKKMPLQMAVASGLLFYIMLLSMTALCFGGQYGAMGSTLLFVMIGSGAGGVLASGTAIKRKRKYHKI